MAFVLIHRSLNLFFIVTTDNVVPIVSGTTKHNFGNINYARNAGTASLTQGTATPTGSFSVQNLKTQLDWTLSATYSDSNAVDAHGNQAVIIPNVALKAAKLNNCCRTKTRRHTSQVTHSES